MENLDEYLDQLLIFAASGVAHEFIKAKGRQNSDYYNNLVDEIADIAQQNVANLTSTR